MHIVWLCDYSRVIEYRKAVCKCSSRDCLCYHNQGWVEQTNIEKTSLLCTVRCWFTLMLNVWLREEWVTESKSYSTSFDIAESENCVLFHAYLCVLNSNVLYNKFRDLFKVLQLLCLSFLHLSSYRSLTLSPDHL